MSSQTEVLIAYLRELPSSPHQWDIQFRCRSLANEAIDPTDSLAAYFGRLAAPLPDSSELPERAELARLFDLVDRRLDEIDWMAVRRALAEFE